jgi:SagB-type dehydrogenase family enzyme
VDDESRPALLTRRQVSALLAGGVVVAGCAGGTRRTAAAGPLHGRRADRVVTLPRPATSGGVSIEEALARRHSVRSFATTALTNVQTAQLLWAAQGVTRSWGGRTAPSAGALYPLDIYVVTASRLWHYLPAGHRADEWRLGDDLRAHLRGATPGQAAVAHAAAVFVVTGTTKRTSGKYGARARRYVELEVGHCAQNLVLQATALGLGGVTIGAFSDDAVALVLGLPAGETPYYLIPVGHPAPGA